MIQRLGLLAALLLISSFLATMAFRAYQRSLDTLLRDVGLGKRLLLVGVLLDRRAVRLTVPRGAAPISKTGAAL